MSAPLFLHLTIGSTITSIPITKDVPIVLQVSDVDLAGRNRERCHKRDSLRCFESQLSELRNRNLNNSRKNLALLRKFDGDVEKVIGWYEKKGNNSDINNLYAAQLEELQKLGFQYPKKNAVLLRKFNGDVERIKQWYESKGSKKDAKFARYQEMRAEYSDQLQKLAELGYTNERKNVQLLKNVFDGDADKVIEWYQDKIKARTRGVDTTESYETQLVTLAEQGYPNKMKNIRLLNKFEGDLDRVIEWYSSKQRKGDKPLPPKFQQLNELYSTQVATIRQLGFPNDRKTLILLKKFEGDTDKVVQWYRNKQQKQQNKALPFKFLKLADRFKDQLVILNQNGHCNAKKNIKLLSKFNGDTDQVLQWYNKKQLKSSF